MAGQYWFARNIRVGYVGRDRYGKGVMPIVWQGRAVIAGFVLAMLSGGLIMLLMGLFTRFFPLGIAIFVILAIAGGGTFIWAVATKSDPDKSIADYRAERARTMG
ncbi:MAG: hypothetical protein E5V49_01775 [Mesorhizobium sp.]|nr:hypothetical protein EN848_07415 [bacterium M00.F.Ca.ET.205.01.1.1]TGU53883.1 hypothetical protein EN795_11840 [bacterium M00.F.Ca.ET.152.01.1.1]TGV37381.1 hypothetical protein EN829_011865 [Mesorhizobium sp. M00.F.Ca.ET.186.01.1.1]TGZ41259.1 hypothetical protein EN805_20985 [bacterium M00.F.Ca.ET.162.01.1.1]TIW62254.1 MAG: hypothetical protein E5V48_05725 [Mesorhizobium sp.]